MTDSTAIRHQPEEGSAIETLQSLVVAFVLAMTFRGFVTEGFVIPTGSMAPTLMGQHYQMHSNQTGLNYATDANDNAKIGKYDPMLGRQTQLAPADRNNPKQSMGDRILVVKCIYPFFEPKRFDVVVFKNPTNPDGPDENFIKRLVGLPNEKLLLVDGDVFVGEPDADINDLVIQRKPVHIQRAVWQPIYNSDYVPIQPGDLDRPHIAPWSGPGWETQNLRSYRCDEPTEDSVLQWLGKPLTTTDWAAYDMMRYSFRQAIINVSDLRISAAINADQVGLRSAFELTTRGHRFEFILQPTDATRQYKAIVRMSQLDNPSSSVEKVQNVKLPAPGKVFNVEFWHVDQTLSIYIDNKLVVGPLEYDWRPKYRMENSYDDAYENILRRLPSITPTIPQLRWRFSGSPVTLHRVRLDRDLYYQPDKIKSSIKNSVVSEYAELVEFGTWAYATHPDKPAMIGPDQFLMLGDNSAFSSDSRLWGAPHKIVAEHIDPSPFLVNRKLLLGKAWVVYFPAPYPLKDGGRGAVPDFGRLRFIR